MGAIPSSVGTAPPAYAGIATAVNSDMTRFGGLLAVRAPTATLATAGTAASAAPRARNERRLVADMISLIPA
jgi:hypothetical protein